MGLDGFNGVTEISIPAYEHDGAVIDASIIAAKTATKANPEGHIPLSMVYSVARLAYKMKPFWLVRMPVSCPWVLLMLVRDDICWKNCMLDWNKIL